ncbi:LysE family translocator [Thiolinea disciformis]|uniref:LysE family translocator n=1 Tax=Thiolinea disciformis TaxID=125614 RepID=UPI00038157E6|nr:LysE family translocator [Thiolinea disciformis]
MTLETFAIFLPTAIFVSITPGMCMTLSLTLGMSIGVKRSLYMMWGELIGVGLIASLAMLGMAAIMLQYPAAFSFLKIAGGLYLAWLGIEMWRSRGRLALPEELDSSVSVKPWDLATRGFITAIANPKGWAFMISLLPPFIQNSQALLPQIAVILLILLSVEFLSLVIYASGGQALRHVLLQGNNVRLLNRIAGSLMMGVGIWLMLS